MGKWDLKECPEFLAGCLPCKRCGNKDEMGCEEPVDGDWDTGERVIRISCGCDQCLDEWESGRCDKDDIRTSGFQPPDCAIAEWNEMQRTDA